MSYETNTRPANIEICNQCLRKIYTRNDGNTRKDEYYCGNRDDKHYYVHAACFKEWMSREGKKI